MVLQAANGEPGSQLRAGDVQTLLLRASRSQPVELLLLRREDASCEPTSLAAATEPPRRKVYW